MEKALVVAKAMYDMYNERFGESMDEMKMHKLMYLLQRESLMSSKKVLFDESFYGWKYGPVLKSVRSSYKSGTYFEDVHEVPSEYARELVSCVLDRYAGLSSWKLSNLSHEEFSWQLARKGLKPSEDGEEKLKVNAMMVDATRESARRRAVG